MAERTKACYLTRFYASHLFAPAADVRSALQIIMICPFGFQIRSELKREKTHWQIRLTKRTRSEGGRGVTCVRLIRKTLGTQSVAKGLKAIQLKENSMVHEHKLKSEQMQVVPELNPI